MAVVVVGLHEKARAKSNICSTPELEKRMYSLDEYLSIARKTIGSFASSSVAQQMLKNEDAIAFIAEHIMLGDARWEESKGRTRRSYLNQCAIWAIKRWLLNCRNATKNSCQSLDTAIDDDGNSLYKFIPDESDSCEETQIQYENIETILSNKGLNDVQRKCLKMKFIDNMTYRAIGQALGKTGARIEQIVNKALSILREDYELQDV